MKRLLSIAVVISLLLLCFAGCSGDTPDETQETTTDSTTAPAQADIASNEVAIVLSDEQVTVGGVAAGETGDVYLSRDVIYYEDRDTYDSGNAYGAGSAKDRHSAEEAAATLVVNITAAGTYRLSGTLSQGQIRIDLGEDSFEDPAAVVNLILDGADITCTTAPAILFMNVYECDNQWSAETATSDVDTTAAGANLILAEGRTNKVNGSHVAKIYKDNGNEKKLWKQDGAIYSYMSMNVSGEGDGSGTLDLTADNEGLDTELHLTINSGNINIRAQDDGINTNEDGVSVTTINGGNVHIIAGLGSEGDGIDSNGYLVINGGTVVASAHPASDAGLDSDLGSFINGGTVVALGSTMDWPESESTQVTINLQFSQYQSSDSAIVVEQTDGTILFAYDPSDDEILGENVRQYMGAIVSCPNFAVGESYHVYIGGELIGEDAGGVYDISSITDYTGGIQQSYTGTDTGAMRPGGMGGMMPGGFGNQGGTPPEKPDGTQPTLPEGETMPTLPEGETMPTLPEGETMPTLPEGETMPENGQQPPQLPAGNGNGQEITSAEASEVFYMKDMVNFFSGVAAFTPSAE